MVYVSFSYRNLLNSCLNEKAESALVDENTPMLSVIPLENHTEQEIKEILAKNHIPYYSEFTEISVLGESGNDEADESYKGIFIDRDTGDFKILSGRFPDKKAMIKKYGVKGKGYITRKVFEKPVFDWISKNAENTLDSYLMFSTALSKWKNNSMLDKYYIKIMNEMPQLFKDVRNADDIHESEMEEAYQFGPADKEHGKVAEVIIRDENGAIIDKSDIPVRYRADEKNILNAPELYEELQWFMKEYPEAKGAYVKLAKDPNERWMDRDTIMRGFQPEVQSNTNWNYDPSMFIKDPEKMELRGYMYVRDAEGKPVKGQANSQRLLRSVDKQTGINDFEVWSAATGILEEFPSAEYVYLNVPSISDKEFVINRDAAFKNFINTHPNNQGATAKIIPWKKSSPTKKFKIYKARGGDKNYIKQYRSAEEFARDQSNKTQESKTMNFREKVNALVEASNIYDLPADNIDLTNNNINHVIKLFVKHLAGKDDVETVQIEKPLGDDVSLEDLNSPEVVAAAKRLKDRNLGKKIFWQTDNEPVQEYIDIEAE